MDQRRESRFTLDQPVVLTLLLNPEMRLQATVTNACSGGLQLVTATAVLPGTAVKIETDDALMLGEIVYCRNEPDRSVIGIELNQVLAGLAALARRLEEHSLA